MKANVEEIPILKDFLEQFLYTQRLFEYETIITITLLEHIKGKDVVINAL